MKCIVFNNLKGGVGKTTSAINTAACLSRAGYRTLLIDLDPQGNASKNLGMPESDFTITDILLQNAKIKAFNVRENLVLIPSSTQFARFETEAKEKLRREELLSKAIEPIKDKVDFIIIDTSPSVGLATVNAYCCADYLIVPMEAQQFALDGLNQVLDLYKAIREQLNSNLDLLGILFTRHRKNVILNKDLYNAMTEAFPGKTFETVIRENVALREAPHHTQTIVDYDLDSNGAKDYVKFTQEVLNRLGI